MNAIVQYDPSVPAHLRLPQFLALNQKAAAGLSQGAPPRLSFRGGRYRLVSADGTETPVNDIMTAQTPQGMQSVQSNGTMIDVIVLDASEHVSKFYYDKAYDPNSDDLSPACFSDNGVGPSIRSTKPQNLLCQSCPKNAWGSKVTPQGTQVKACSDVKKLAVIPVGNVTGEAYVLAIPAASLKSWTATVNALSQRNIPIPAMVIRLGFDQEPAYPKLTFSPVRWISEGEAAAINDLFGSEECADLVGRKDTAIQVMPGLPAPTAQPAPLQPTTSAAPAPMPQHVAAMPVAAQPIPAQPAPFPAMQPVAAVPIQVAAQAPVVDAAPRRRRGRPAANADAQTAAPALAPAPAPAAAAMPQDLNALLDSVMKG